MKKITLLLLPFLYLFILLFQIDQSMLEDLGRHLKMGEAIVQCLCVPQTNLFSYTNSDFPVINHEWLTQLVLYLVYKTFGLNSLLIFKMIILSTAFAIVYFLAKQKSSWFWLTIVSLFCIMVFSSRFRVRPEMFSYIFAALFLLIIYLYQQGKPKILHPTAKPSRQNSKTLFVLPLIELLWVNMHIYFILGIMIYVTFLIQDYLIERKRNAFLLIIGGMVLFATLLNPQFIRGALLPFTFQSNYGLSVEENMSVFDVGKYAPSFIYTLMLQVVTFEALVVLFFVAIPILFRKKSLATTLNGAAAAMLGVRYVRSISLFGLLGLQPFSEKLTLIEKSLREKTDKYFLNTAKGIVLLTTLLVSFLYVKGLYQYHVLQFGYQPYAEGAVDFINNNHVKGPIFNNYHIGNYLIYGLYPREKIFIDARPEMYPAAFLKEYERMLTDQNFFNQQIKRYNINLIVFGVQLEDPLTIRPFMLRQIQSKEWIPIFADGNVTILIKNNDGNKDVIKRLRLSI